MSYIVATYMDIDAWNKTGVNWLRKAKSAGLTGFVIGNNLPSEAVAKAKELGFEIYPIVNERDKFQVIVENIQKDQRCLLVNSDVTPKADLPETKEVTCYKDESLDLFDILIPVKNLQDRSKSYSLLLNEIINVHEGLLSCNCILGTWEFWNSFNSFHNYLQERNSIDKQSSYGDLALNLHIALNSISLEVLS
jgi:hypothetical protein